MASKTTNSVPKVTVAATSASSLDSSLAGNETGFQPPERRPVQANIAILAAVLLPCIPIIVISGVLLGLIFYHRIELNPGYAELRLREDKVVENAVHLITLIRKQGGKWAYFVKYNPSTLTTIASWTSRILPWCASSVMALVAFYAARHIVLQSHRGDGSNLPSPQQLTLLISVLEGSSWGPVKDAVLHRYRSKERLVSPLPASVFALFALTLMGVIIPILDSWFGVATTAPIVTQLYPRAAKLSFGRQLSSQYCGNGPGGPPGPNGCLLPADENTFWPCSVMNYNCEPVATLYGMSEASKTAQNASSLNKVWEYTDSSSTAYYYLGSPNQDASLDFKAKTIAASTHCIPMTKACSLYNPNAPFDDPSSDYSLVSTYNCTSAFTGSIYSSVIGDSSTYAFPNVGIAFAQNPELTVAGNWVHGPRPESEDSNQNFSFAEIYPTNPLYFGAWAAGYPPSDPSTMENIPFANDPGVFWIDQIGVGGAVWELNCSTTVYDVSYTWINGTVNTFNMSKSTADMAALLSAPFAYAANLSAIPFSLASAAQLASTADTSTGIANTFARELSKNMLTYSVGAFDPALNLLEQGRNSTLRVARVPMVPLYLLLATKSIFVVVVVVLAIGVYCFSNPSETEAVRFALSAKGLAAAHFEAPSVVQASVVKEVQSRLEAMESEHGEMKSMGTTPSETGGVGDDVSPPPRLQHAATAPVHGTAPPLEARVGLLPTADGTWQFVMVANGVWNAIKPIVQSIVVSDANGGGLGDVGKVISAWE